MNLPSVTAEKIVTPFLDLKAQKSAPIICNPTSLIIPDRSFSVKSSVTKCIMILLNENSIPFIKIIIRISYYPHTQLLDYFWK